MSLSPTENYLEAIRYGSPDYIPRGNEDIFYGFNLEANKIDANWVDQWGISWVVELEDTSPFPKRNPLDNIMKLSSYKFPNPDDIFVNLEDIRINIKKAKSKGKLVMGGFSYLLYERAWALMGMENFLMATITNPEEVKLLLRGIAEYARKVCDNFMEMGVDAITFSEDLGSQNSLMFSPEFFKRYFIPEYRYIFKNVLKENKIINFHSCGCIQDIVEDLADLGITVLNPIQSRANDLNKVKKAAFGKLALAGGIDSHLLMTGTPEQVEEETLRVIKILKPGAGYVCTPDQYFPNMPIKNIQALYRTVEKNGLY